MLDIKLDTLLAVYEEKSFTKAAMRLNLTQPAVSNHIRMWEKEIGHPLCTRIKGDLIFTTEGEIAVNYAKRFKSVYVSMCEEIAEKQKTPKHIKIGVTRAIESDPSVATAIGRYASSNPGTNITILSGIINELYEKLENYELDIIIIDDKTNNAPFSYRVLAQDELVCFISTKNPLSHEKRIRLSDLKKEPMIMWLPTSSNRILFESALADINESIDNFNIIMEIDSISTIKLLVSKDVGVSLVPKRLCEHRTKYVGVPIENINITRKVSLVYRKDFAYTNILDELSQLYETEINR